MSILHGDDLMKLVEEQAGACVSIYLPTHRSMPEAQQNPIRFRNLLREAEEQLTQNGLRAPEAKHLLEPARQLLEESGFWQHQSDGLAVFVSRRLFRFYCLPINFQELTVVTGRFHLKPLLSVFTSDGRFYILALSQNQVRLFQGTRYSVNELFPRGIPENLQEALRYDDPQRQLQFHTRAPKRGARRAAVFHGHGVGIDDTKDRILRYFRQVDGGLHPLFRNERAPLLLAAVDYFFPIYKEANTYSHLMDAGIPGNPELLSATQLHQAAWSLVEPVFRQAQEKAADQYRQLAGTGRTSSDIRQVIPAALQGRLESLFVAVGTQSWGTFDPQTGVVDPHPQAEPGDQDLLDLAAIQTLIHGGTVFAVAPFEVPEDAPLAALFRY